MEWFLKVVRDNYANFDGRARRKEYWMFFLFYMIGSVITGILDGMLNTSFIGLIYSLALLVPSIAVGVRRMHDVGKSGWFLLIPIYSFILAVTNGQVGDNEYGPDPKGSSEFKELGNN